MSKLSMADSHDNQQNIIEKAKEINQKVKEKQANTKANISSEIGNEEPLPLNDPFVGDSSLSGGGTLLASDPNEAQNEIFLVPRLQKPISEHFYGGSKKKNQWNLPVKLRLKTLEIA